jgi:type IV conjugative transfer system coupling protein TraD
MSTFSGAFTQGGQTQLHTFRMIAQVVASTLKIALWVFGLSFVLLVYLSHTWQELWFLLCYLKAFVRLEYFAMLSQGFFDSSYLVYADSAQFHEVSDYVLTHTDDSITFAWFMIFSLLKKLLQAAFLSFVSMGVMAWFWVRRGRKKQESKVLSGAQIVTPQTLLKQVYKTRQISPITLARIPYVSHSAREHTLLVGTTGTGKSNAMNELLMQIRDLKGKAVIVDTTGGFVHRFFEPEKDTLLNPLDGRSEAWDLWQECQEDYLFDMVAESIIPQTSHDPFWSMAARTVLAEGSKKMCMHANPSIAKLLPILLTSSLKEVYAFLEGTTAQSMLSPDSEKTALSVRATLSSHIKGMHYLTRLEKVGKPPFSIRAWIQDEEQRSFLFLTCTPEQRSALVPLLTAWLSIATRCLMTQPQDSDTWFFIDELASLNHIPDLTKALAEVRKYGGCFVVGMQTLSQIDEIYGANGSRTLCGLTGTKVIFRSPDAHTAKRMSEFLGEQEVIERGESISYGAHQMRDGVSLSDQKRTKSLVPYTEIMTLNNLEAYLQMPHNLPIAKIKFTYHE